MPLRDLLYRCTHCGDPQIEGAGPWVLCTSCGRRVTRKKGGGGRLFVEDPLRRPEGEERGSLTRAEGKWKSVSELVDQIENLGGASFQGAFLSDRVSARVRIASASGSGEPLHFQSKVLGFVERFRPARNGTLRLDATGLSFHPDPGAQSSTNVLRYPYLELTALQTSSTALQWVDATGIVTLVRFEDDSLRRWDDLVKGEIRGAWHEAGRGDILEFQPWIRGPRAPLRPVETPHRARRLVTAPVRGSATPFASAPGPKTGASFPTATYRVARSIARALLPRLAPIRVEGTEHLPKVGPFLLLPNHQSALDPLLVQGFAPRIVRSMTKSTQFGSAFMSHVLPRLGAFPVRRFRIDPQTVRTALRLLNDGHGVCIYPEGERCWDGRIQPFRNGTLRVALAAMDSGIPVIPVGISGMFEVWPRWAGPIRGNHDITLRFGEPLRVNLPASELGALHDGIASASSRISDFERVLRSALRNLSGE